MESVQAPKRAREASTADVAWKWEVMVASGSRPRLDELKERAFPGVDPSRVHLARTDQLREGDVVALGRENAEVRAMRVDPTRDNGFVIAAEAGPDRQLVTQRWVAHEQHLVVPKPSHRRQQLPTDQMGRRLQVVQSERASKNLLSRSTKPLKGIKQRRRLPARYTKGIGLAMKAASVVAVGMEQVKGTER